MIKIITINLADVWYIIFSSDPAINFYVGLILAIKVWAN